MSRSSKFVLIAFLVIFLRGLPSQGQDILPSFSITTGNYQFIEILELLSDQGIRIAYSANKVPKVTCIVDHNYKTIEGLLDFLKTQERFKYTISEGQVILSFQERPSYYTIRGFVRDKATGEALIGAVIYKKGTTTGVVTNSYGYFSISLPPDLHSLNVSYVGYKSLEKEYNMSNTGAIAIIQLEEKVKKLNSVTISSVEPDFNISSLIPGINTLDLNTEGSIPYFLGEVDVLQGATYLPGINTLGEDANGIHVRGGRSDQNLILLDEALIYNPNHLNGLISIFNPEAVKNVEIMKGFIPAEHGGRASSVISVQQKDGDDQNLHLTGGIGLVSAKLIAEGPIKKEVSSFIVSARQSLLNLAFDNNSSSRFNDFNAKVNWKASRKNTFYLSGYWGNDSNTNVLDTQTRWGNRNFSLRWNHLFGKRIFSNFSTILSEYNYNITQPREAASFIGKSRIIDYTVKADFGFVINPRNELLFGGISTMHVLRPGSREPFDIETSSANTLILDSEHGLESAAYISHEAELTSNLSLLYGLRFSGLQLFGSDTVFTYDPSLPKSGTSIIDTTYFGDNSESRSFWNIEPRLSLNYKTSFNSSIKISYTRSNQYLHLISNTVTPSPTDIWKLSDQFIQPTTSDHFSLGYYQNFSDHKYEGYIDVYYKALNHLIEYKDGANLLFNKNIETELLSAEGRAYGLEFFLKKNTGKITGWLSYTLSRAEQRVISDFEEESINDGAYFSSNNDRRHDISLVGIYKLNRRLSTSAVFNYTTGRPYSLPLGQYEFEGNVVPYFGFRNEGRLPDYHRLDLSLKWAGRSQKRNGGDKSIQDYWTFVLYNTYSRDNVYSYLFQRDEETGTTAIVPNTIFDTIIPAITYNFKF